MKIQQNAKYFLAEGFLSGYRCEINLDAYERYLAARGALFALDNVEQLFSICALSYVEFEKLLAAGGIEYMLSHHTVHEIPSLFGSLRLQLNLKISGILTAFRAYKDQCQKRLEPLDVFSSGSAPDMQTEFAKHFDNSIEHRIMEVLRNYAQHSDLPLYSTSYSHQNQWEKGGGANGGPSRSRITINPYFSASALVSTKRLRPKTRQEISDLNIEKLDTKMLVRKYLADFYACHDFMKKQTDWIIDHAGAIVEDSYVFLSREKGKSVKFVELQKVMANGETVTFHLPNDFAGELKKLRTRWRYLSAVCRQYYSSEAVFAKDVFLGSDETVWIPE